MKILFSTSAGPDHDVQVVEDGQGEKHVRILFKEQPTDAAGMAFILAVTIADGLAGDAADAPPLDDGGPTEEDLGHDGVPNRPGDFDRAVAEWVGVKVGYQSPFSAADGPELLGEFGPLGERLPACKWCTKYFAHSRCGKETPGPVFPTSYGEGCDCPRCQGLCECGGAK